MPASGEAHPAAGTVTRKSSRSAHLCFLLMCCVASCSDIMSIVPSIWSFIRVPGVHCPVLLWSCGRPSEQRGASLCGGDDDSDATTVMGILLTICRVPLQRLNPLPASAWLFSHCMRICLPTKRCRVDEPCYTSQAKYYPAVQSGQALAGTGHGAASASFGVWHP